MNGTSRGAAALARSIAEGHADGAVDVAVCPPFPYLEAVAGVVAGTRGRARRAGRLPA